MVKQLSFLFFAGINPKDECRRTFRWKLTMISPRPICWQIHEELMHRFPKWLAFTYSDSIQRVLGSTGLARLAPVDHRLIFSRWVCNT